MDQRNEARGFLDRFHIHSKSQDSDETVLRDKQTGEFVLMKEIQLNSNDEFRKVIETLQSQRELRNDHLLSLLDYQAATDYDPMEGVRHKVLTFFQYSSHNLQQQIDARYEQNRLFEEGELWNISASCVFGLAYLQRQAVGHGCISPIDIFITKDGIIHVVDPSIASAEPFTVQEGYYYSPEVLECIAQQMRRPSEQLDIFRSDVFSLGVCMLHAAMLESTDDCYNYANCDINYEQIQKKLELVAEHYSEGFVEVLACMLKYEPNQRPDFIELERHFIGLMDADDSLRQSTSSLRSSWGTGYKSTVSRLTTNNEHMLQPAQPLAEDNGDSQRSELTGTPHCETFEEQLNDESQIETSKQDNFSKLLRNGLALPRQEQGTYQKDTSLTLIKTPSSKDVPPAPQQQEEIVERVLKIDFIPESHENSHSFTQKRQGIVLPTNEPANSFGSSFGPIYFENPSNKSIFEVKEPSFSSSNFEAEPFATKSFGLRDQNRFAPIQESTPIQFESFSKSPSSYQAFNPTQSKPSESSYYYSSKDENLFTDPALLNMVREDVNKIMSKAQRNKQNQHVN